ncbi:acyltransferase [bacterium]|nr:acyltransferase [bacterium]
MLEQESKLKRNYRPEIDGLRAIAISWVVINHFFPKLLPSGFIGVDLFFVISGYLISGNILHSLRKGQFSLMEFYARRFRRILPALILLLISVFVFGIFFASAGDFEKFGTYLWSAATFTSNFVLASEAGYFDSASIKKPLLHLWTLAVEEQFYLIWPILLWIAFSLRMAVGRVIAFLFSISFIYGIWRYKNHPIEAFYYLPARFWELLAGGALAYAEVSGPLKSTLKKVSPNFRANLGLFALMIGTVLIHERSPFPKWWAISPVLAAVLIISSEKESWLNKHVLSSKGLVWLGLISYPLYLWHWPLLVLRNQLHDTHSIDVPTGVLLPLSVGLSWATFRFLEKPIQNSLHLSHKLKSRNWKVVLISLGVCAVLSLLGVAIRNHRILSQDERHFPQAYPILKAYTDFDYSVIRMTRCHLDTTVPFRRFEPECYSNSIPSSKKKILLLGDSIAAHLYPGLRAISRDLNSEVYQMNASTCPVFLKPLPEDQRNCKAASEYALNKIREVKPDTAIFFGDWTNIAKRKDFWNRLKISVKQIKEAGVKEVIVLGPQPNWKESLPNLVVKTYVRQGLPVPKRSATGLVEGLFSDDATFEARAQEMGYRYVSAIRLLCEQESCLIRVGSNLKTDLMSYDGAHLTVPASTYLAGLLKPVIKKYTFAP